MPLAQIEGNMQIMMYAMKSYKNKAVVLMSVKALLTS